jgi:hypothetical protein
VAETVTVLLEEFGQESLFVCLLFSSSLRTSYAYGMVLTSTYEASVQPAPQKVKITVSKGIHVRCKQTGGQRPPDQPQEGIDEDKKGIVDTTGGNDVT